MVCMNVDDDILWGPQFVLEAAAGKGNRIPDATTMRIRPTADSYFLDPIATFELKPGPYAFNKPPRSDTEELTSSPPLAVATRSDPRSSSSETLQANKMFQKWYLQVCEQASRALDQRPAGASFPAFFLTGFYFYLIILRRPGQDSDVARGIPPTPHFQADMEDAGFNDFLKHAYDELGATKQIVELEYEVKYFCERFLDRDTKHLTARFARALRLVIEQETGLLLQESWFTAFADSEEGAANTDNIVRCFSSSRRHRLTASSRHVDIMKYFSRGNIQLSRSKKPLQR